MYFGFAFCPLCIFSFCSLKMMPKFFKHKETALIISAVFLVEEFMTIQEILIDDLKPYENNPRKNDSAVEAVKKSIQQFGFKEPIVIDKDNVIVCGHTRLKAAKLLGLEKIPCVIADDLTPEQIKAFRLIDNKTAELAEWDFEKLENELSNIEIPDFDISEFDFGIKNFSEETFKNFEENVSKAKEKKVIVCPKCGEEIQL